MSEEHPVSPSEQLGPFRNAPRRRGLRPQHLLPAGVAAAGVLFLLPLADLVSALENWPTPLGVFPVAALCAFAMYLAVRHARRVLARATEVRPIRPVPTWGVPRGLREALEAARKPPTTEVPALAPPAAKATEGETARLEGGLSDLPVLAAHATVIPQRRGYSAYTPPPPEPRSAGKGVPPSAPPPKGGFGWKIAIAYAAIAAPLLGFSPLFLAHLKTWLFGTPFPAKPPPALPVFFTYYDVLVQWLGELIYWPQSWPGPHRIVKGQLTIVTASADYIFTMYLILMLAFLVASAFHARSGLGLSQWLMAAGVIGGYVVAALFTEVFFYAIRPSFFYSSIALLGRAFIGGLFFSFLLFSLLMAPPVMVVRPRFARVRVDIAVFFMTAACSLALAFHMLYGAYTLLGIGSSTFSIPLTGGVQATLRPFAILLLLPMTALTIWALIGRALYQYELSLRPVPSIRKYHPAVSVMIPAYNEEASIAGTVLSADLAARLYPGAVEIIVGNDGSSDRTSERAREALSRLRYARGKVVDLPHGGKSNALNGALRAATGEIVVRVDADTRMSPDYGFAAMVPHFADPQVGGVQGLILPLQSEGWTRKLRMLELVWNHLFLRRAYYGTRTAQVVDGAYCAFRRSDILSVGGWVPWNGEDTEITYRLQRQGFRFRYETKAVAYEDVPADYKQLKKQRVRWTRGGYFAHHRHYPALFSEAPEFGGLAILLWLAIFIRGGMRHMVYLYAALMTFFLDLQTLQHMAIVVALLLLPRGLAMAYYLARLNAWRYLPWVLSWPVTSAVKQFISMEGFGSILPGGMPEFSE
ncbi:MAG: glycosyltransferase family 2 protein [Euryarchaeota archaeon]|nr:glycosyltransferase family 2 protein [Euryarchaeota archaeon]